MTPEPNPIREEEPRTGVPVVSSRESVHEFGNGAGADVLRPDRPGRAPGPAQPWRSAAGAGDRDRGGQPGRSEGSTPSRSTPTPAHRPPEAGPGGVEAAASSPPQTTPTRWRWPAGPGVIRGQAPPAVPNASRGAARWRGIVAPAAGVWTLGGFRAETGRPAAKGAGVAVGPPGSRARRPCPQGRAA